MKLEQGSLYTKFGYNALGVALDDCIKTTRVEDRLATWSQGDLLDVCKLNKVPHSGRRAVMIRRMALYARHGLPGKCPVCSRGNLRWKAGVRASMYCPGFWSQERKVQESCSGPTKEEATAVRVADWQWGTNKKVTITPQRNAADSPAPRAQRAGPYAGGGVSAGACQPAASSPGAS